MSKDKTKNQTPPLLKVESLFDEDIISSEADNLGLSTKRQEMIGAIKSITFFLIIAIFLRASVVEAFKIPSGSMERTLVPGDHILVNKLSYGIRFPFIKKTIYLFDLPSRGDVVVFTRPDDPTTPDVDEAKINIIKRVIGLPGDVVEVRGTAVFINKKRLEEDSEYAQYLRGGLRDFGPTRVPNDSVFLLGDNRDHSFDSRFWSDHFLELSRIKGRAFMIYWNFSSLKRMFSVIR
jgi:signal peptidase I